MYSAQYTRDSLSLCFFLAAVPEHISLRGGERKFTDRRLCDHEWEHKRLQAKQVKTKKLDGHKNSRIFEAAPRYALDGPNINMDSSQKMYSSGDQKKTLF